MLTSFKLRPATHFSLRPAQVPAQSLSPPSPAHQDMSTLPAVHTPLKLSNGFLAWVFPRLFYLFWCVWNFSNTSKTSVNSPAQSSPEIMKTSKCNNVLRISLILFLWIKFPNKFFIKNSPLSYQSLKYPDLHGRPIPPAKCDENSVTTRSPHSCHRVLINSLLASLHSRSFLYIDDGTV